MIPRAGGAAPQGQVSPAIMDGIFRALSDPTRRDVLDRLSAHSASVSDLAATYDMALPSFVEHLKVLEHSGLVRSHKTGRIRTYELVPKQMKIAENSYALSGEGDDVLLAHFRARLGDAPLTSVEIELGPFCHCATQRDERRLEEPVSTLPR